MEMSDEFHALAALSQSENFVVLCCLSVDCEQGIHRKANQGFCTLCY